MEMDNGRLPASPDEREQNKVVASKLQIDPTDRHRANLILGVDSSGTKARGPGCPPDTERGRTRWLTQPAPRLSRVSPGWIRRGCLRVTIPVMNPELIPTLLLARHVCDVRGFRGLGPITENKEERRMEGSPIRRNTRYRIPCCLVIVASYQDYSDLQEQGK